MKLETTTVSNELCVVRGIPSQCVALGEHLCLRCSLAQSSGNGVSPKARLMPRAVVDRLYAIRGCLAWEHP
jgi:hypothetical protein